MISRLPHLILCLLTFFEWFTGHSVPTLNQLLRNRDKLKDDAIAHQFMALSTRLQEVERRQQLFT